MKNFTKMKLVPADSKCENYKSFKKTKSISKTKVKKTNLDLDVNKIYKSNYKDSQKARLYTEALKKFMSKKYKDFNIIETNKTNKSPKSQSVSKEQTTQTENKTPSSPIRLKDLSKFMVKNPSINIERLPDSTETPKSRPQRAVKTTAKKRLESYYKKSQTGTGQKSIKLKWKTY